MRRQLYLGCTRARHAAIGVDAVINARAGLQHLNDLSDEDIALRRDANNVADYLGRRVRFYQFNSRFCRRNIAKLGHLLATRED